MITRLIKLSITLIYFFCLRSIRLVRVLFRMDVHGTCVVLYYHSVRPDQKNKFEKQMDALLKFAQPVAANYSGKLEKGRHHAAVTFDDGYVSVLEQAVPILVERNIPVAIFIASDFIGKDWDWSVASPENRENPGGDERVMDVAQLKALPRPLVTLGSHTVTHPKMTAIPAGEAEAEFKNSKSQLEFELNQSMDLFAFPFGFFNEGLVQLARKCGYKRVFTTQPVLYQSELDAFEVGRVVMEPDMWPIEFKLKLLGGYAWFASYLKFKQKFQ